MARRVKKQQGKHVVLLGAGYTARALIPHLLDRGYRVTATNRTVDENLPPTVKALQFDGDVSAELRAALGQCDYLLSSIGPSKLGDPVLDALADIKTAAPHVEWAGYLSATSVYGDRGGQWAFEDELLYPQTRRGKARTQAEIAWLETGLPVHVFRLAGIYGPGRAPFGKLQNAEARAVIKDGHIVNRIHVEDICSAILASLDAPNPLRLYNIADGNPCPPQDVLDYAASLIGVPAPPRVTINDESVSNMARTFYSETKRIDITRARKELGWEPKYADYKSGLAQILDAKAN